MADGSHGGRLGSWVAVSVMVAGFTVGGIGLMLGPAWWAFWAGVVVVAVGGVLALAVGIFSDVMIDAPREINLTGEPADAEHPAAG
jgi:hypothetical protein